jgi:hypothetical protein
VVIIDIRINKYKSELNDEELKTLEKIITEYGIKIYNDIIKENGILLEQDGTVVEKWTGTIQGLSTPPRLESKITAELNLLEPKQGITLENFAEEVRKRIYFGRILIHNHPNNTYFSECDLNTLTKYELAEIRVYTLKKEIFILKRLDNVVYPDGFGASMVSDIFYEGYVHDLIEKYNLNTSDSSFINKRLEALNIETHLWYTNNAKYFGYEYERRYLE